MQIDTSAVQNGSALKHVKFDNLFDVLFNDAARPKENLTKKLIFNGERLDFMETSGQNVQFVETVGSRKTVEVDKLKITK